MKPARRFTATVLLGSCFLALAAFIYARIKGLPATAAVPLAAAFLVEFPFYIFPSWLSAFPQVKKQHRNPLIAALILTATCLLPYLVYSLPTNQFQLPAFLTLTAIALVLAFWFEILPGQPIAGLAFLAFAAAVYLSKVFDAIYISPIPKLQISLLGHGMLIRLCATQFLLHDADPPEFRFLPTAREFRIGLLWCAALIPACALTLFAVKLNAAPHAPKNAWLILPEFLGILWFVALSEEFVFRGLLQQWFEKWTHSSTAGLIAASLLFGAAHLGFNRIFPNWRFAIVAAVFGLFCGLAWRQTRSIQSAMVTHALAATLYRLFFQ